MADEAKAPPPRRSTGGARVTKAAGRDRDRDDRSAKAASRDRDDRTAKTAGRDRDDRTAKTASRDRHDREVREAILSATRRLLDERRFDELSVADILATAGVARGSFYFYFAGKHQVLAELIRRAVARGQEVAEPWLTTSNDPRDTVRHGISQGAKLWRAEAPVLRAIVENWRTDPELADLWLELMGAFTSATATRIAADQPRHQHSDAAPTDPVDPDALAAALTWLGERLYYLAAIDVPPFADEDALVDVLTHIWMRVLY